MARNIPDWIQGYVDYTRHLEAPTVFHMWAAIGTIAGALRGKVLIDQGYFSWKPNFFIIFVAPPGIVSKSTSMGVGLSMLRQVKGIHFGPDSATWQAVTEAFQESAESFSFDGKSVVMSPITVGASELGTFLDPRNREMLDVLNDLWDGRDVPWVRRTKAEGVREITNPWFHFMGCTTPGWIEENWPEYAIKGGFASRTLFIYADKKRHYEAYPGLAMEKEKDAIALLKGKLITDLRRIAELSGRYTLSDNAVGWGTDWYKIHWEKDSKKVDQELLGGYLARKQTHIHKLGMVLTAATTDEMVIREATLRQAAAMVTSLESNFGSVFAAMGDNRQARYALAIVKIVEATNGVAKQECWKRLMKYMTIDEFKVALVGAVMAGAVKEHSNGTSIMLKPVRTLDASMESGRLPPEIVASSQRSPE